MNFVYRYQRYKTGISCKTSRFYFPYFDTDEFKARTRFSLKNVIIPQFKPGDVLIVSDLAQLGDNVAEVLQVIIPLLKRNIRINITNIGMIDNTDRGYWIMKTLLAVARQEKDITRVQLLQKTKRKNKGGRPRRKLTPKYKAALIYLDNHTYSQTVDKFDISRSTVKRIKKQFGKDIKNLKY